MELLLSNFIKKNTHKCCNEYIKSIYSTRLRDVKECKHCLLYFMCEENNFELCKLFLKKYKLKKFKGCSKYLSHLNISCANENFEICELLIENGADVNARFSDKKTPLGIACQCGNFKICKLLIEKGADTNLKSVKEPPLIIASLNGNFEICKLLLENKADVNQVRKDIEESSLHASIHRHNFNICRLLLKYGADVNQIKRFGDTPLSICVNDKSQNNSKSIEIFKLLIKNGADVNYSGRECNEYQRVKPLLQLAISRRNVEKCQILIENGVNVNEKLFIDYKNLEFSYLSYACQLGDFEICKLLIENGADITQGTREEKFLDPNDQKSVIIERKSPLLISLNHKQSDIIDLLIKHERKIIQIIFLGHKKDPNCLIYEYNFPWSILKIILFFSGYSYTFYLEGIDDYIQYKSKYSIDAIYYDKYCEKIKRRKMEE